MAVYQNPEFLQLFEVYTGGGRETIGAHFSHIASLGDLSRPLIVSTNGDMALFPGNGGKPTVQSFRNSNRGFKEITAVSHLGVATASLVSMRKEQPENRLWRSDAERLYAATETARKINTVELWRDQIAVEAYHGREQAIVNMTDYACAMTLRFLDAVFKDESKLTPEFLRDQYLEPVAGNELGATTSINAVMIATFFLVGMEASYRINRWFKEQQVDWPNAMVLVTGRQGRVSAGVTLSTNAISQWIIYASQLQLPPERLFITPHALTFTLTDPVDWEALNQLEPQFRSIWSNLRAVTDLGPIMFEGYPRYKPQSAFSRPVLEDDATELSEMPSIKGPDDMRSLTTRLRILMEDPRQQLAGAAADYAAYQLYQSGSDLSRIVVPGLDGCSYPTGL